MWRNLCTIFVISVFTLKYHIIEANSINPFEIPKPWDNNGKIKPGPMKIVDKGVNFLLDKSGIGLSWDSIISASNRLKGLIGKVPIPGLGTMVDQDSETELFEYDKAITPVKAATTLSFDQLNELLKENIPKEHISKIMNVLNQANAKGLNMDHEESDAGFEYLISSLLETDLKENEKELASSELNVGKNKQKKKKSKETQSLPPQASVLRKRYHEV